MKDRIVDLFTKNIGLKMMSIAIAVMLWFMVVRVDDPTITKIFNQIPIDIVNEEVITDTGKVYDIEDDVLTTSVIVTAKRSVLDILSRDDFRAVADMTRLNADSVPIEVRANKYSDRIDNLAVRGRSSLKLDIENQKEARFNIKVVTNGTIPEGYTVGDIILKNNVVRVSGPESIVNSVYGAVVNVDVTNMKNDISTTEDIVLVDQIGSAVDMERLNVSWTSVGVTVQMWRVKEIPITYGYIGECAEGYGADGINSVNPKTVSVAGTEEMLAKVDKIDISANQIDITGASDDVERTFNVIDLLKGKAKYIDDGISDGVITVTIGVDALQKKMVEVPVTNILVDNVPAGMTATVGGLGDVMAVEVCGIGENFDLLLPETITGIIDCSNIDFGDEMAAEAYDVPVVLVFPEGISGGENDIVAQLILQKAE